MKKIAVELSEQEVRCLLGTRPLNTNTLIKVGKEVGITPERVRQLSKRAHNKIAQALEEQADDHASS